MSIEEQILRIDAELKRLMKMYPSIYKTDKVVKGLIPIYYSIFEEFNIRHVTLLEIGVLHGGFLRWIHDINKFDKIIGIDINIDDAVKELSDLSNILLYQGSQSDVPFLEGIAKEHGGFDVVIDDGSHFIEDVKVSFEALWKHTRIMYIIEDWDVMFEWGTPGWLEFMQEIMYRQKEQLAIKEVRMGFRHTWGQGHGAYMMIKRNTG